jgi:hypothetical protein
MDVIVLCQFSPLQFRARNTQRPAHHTSRRGWTWNLRVRSKAKCCVLPRSSAARSRRSVGKPPGPLNAVLSLRQSDSRNNEAFASASKGLPYDVTVHCYSNLVHAKAANKHEPGAEKSLLRSKSMTFRLTIGRQWSEIQRPTVVRHTRVERKRARTLHFQLCCEPNRSLHRFDAAHAERPFSVRGSIASRQ